MQLEVVDLLDRSGIAGRWCWLSGDVCSRSHVDKNGRENNKMK